MALIAVFSGCEIVDGTFRGESERRLTNESALLVQQYLSAPVSFLREMLLIDRYLSDPEGLGDTTGFAALRRNLLRGDAGSYLYKPLGTISTAGKSLRASGTAWTLKADPNRWPLEFPNDCFEAKTLTFACQQDSLWACKYGEVSTVMAELPDRLFMVSVAGKKKTADGYDCDLKTVGEFRAHFDAEHKLVLNGRFHHMISRNSKVLDVCEATFVDGKATYKTSR